MRGGDRTRDEIEALDRRWEARLGSNRDDGPAPDLDPELLLAVERLYALDDTPGADPAFVRRLEEALMTGIGALPPAARDGRVALLDEGRRTPRPVPPGHPAEVRRGRFGAVVSAAALLLVVLAVGLVAVRLGDDGSDTGGFVATPAPLGSPTAAECDVAPRTAAPAPIAGTPAPGLILEARVYRDTRLELAPADVPSGPPASAEEIAGISATLRVLVACETRKLEAQEQEGQWDANERILALFTDDYLRRHLDSDPETGLGSGTPIPEWYPWWGPYWGGSAWGPGRQATIEQTVRLPSGRVGAVVFNGPSSDYPGDRAFVVFVHVGDRWLIDEVAQINPYLEEGTPSAGDFDGGPAIALVLAEIVYYPTQLGIPPDTDVALTLANVGKAPHTFNVDALGIHVELEPGTYQTITVNAPAGTYPFYCSVPGHQEAGMTGTLIVGPAFRLPVAAAPTTPPNPTASPVAEEPRTTDGYVPGTVVVATDDDVNFRQGPDFTQEPIRVLTRGEELTVIDGPVEGDGAVWYQVEDAEGVVGWVVAEFIAESP